MKSILPILIILVISFSAKSQLTKGNWMISGSASISTLESSSTATAQFKQTNIQLSSGVGYFLKDKFAVGLKPSISYGDNSVANSNTIIGIGPLVRYYFLNTDRVFNLFTEGSYSYGIITYKGGISSRSNGFSISGGSVIFFNSSVGLEFNIAYSTTKVIGFTGTNNEIRFGIGFQFHLEKDK